jgi:hypothetical protein
MASRRQRILEALKARVEAITIANGFQTDIGLTVLLGETPTFGPDDATQVLAILPGEDQILGQQAKVSILLPVNIAVIVSPDIAQPWVIVEQALSDIKQAVELVDRSLGGLLTPGDGNVEGLVRGTTEIFERTSGSDAIGAAITYGCKYAESWGNPEA